MTETSDEWTMVTDGWRTVFFQGGEEVSNEDVLLILKHHALMSVALKSAQAERKTMTLSQRTMYRLALKHADDAANFARLLDPDDRDET